MVRLADGEPPRSAYPRPQTPKPPFPYASRELVVPAPDGGKLAGTLTVPPGPGPFPALLLLSGSGQQDRDETIFGHKPYLILADRLTRDGFAVYRFDDRGTGKTTGAIGTLDTEIADAGAVVELLATQPEIDPKRIGIIGHSTGGMVTPNVAVAHPVAFVVSLAGPSVSGRELVPLQLAISARARGAPETQVSALVELQTKVGAAVLEGEARLRATLTEVTRPQLAAALGRAPTEAEIAQAIAKPVADALQPWTLSFFRLDPRIAWRKLQIPILLVIGDRDTQVPADITIKTLQESLSPAAAARLVVAKRRGLNHLFQNAKTGALDEYVELDESFDPATLDLISGWLAERAKPK
jgi:pimeloyl-ACP methyl ester carboxylesterase